MRCVSYLSLIILYIERLSTARASDEFSNLNVINKDLENLLEGLNASRKRTLKEITAFERLVDFKELAKNPAKKRVGIQTDTDFTMQIEGIVSWDDSDECRVLAPLVKYINPMKLCRQTFEVASR